ncbi:MAG: hypothetical protein HY313_01585 [Acidobacteria bacterium]|nr:hypothetical protein [Acidobacteriota bacterium]
MNSILSRVVVVLFLALSARQSLQAKECGNEDYKGAYGVLALGSIVGGAPPEFLGPFARVGRQVSDGKGSVSVESTISINGLILPQSFSGTYFVSPDCTITFSFLETYPGDIVLPFTVFGVISENGREVFNTIISPPGTVIRGPIYRRQEKSNCSNQDLSKGFQLNMSGTIEFQPGVPALGSFTRVGRLEFDGKGGFTAKTYADYNGFAGIPENFSGTYSVDSLCNVTIEYTLGLTYTWVGTLTDNSSRADLIVVSPPGATVVGTLAQQ